jgi:hypothetical protein
MQELWRVGEEERALELVDDEIVIDATQRVFNPATFQGHEGIRELIAGTFEVWGSFETEPDRWEAVGDSTVVVGGRYTAVSREGGVELSGEYAEIWTLDEGLAIHWDLPYNSFEEAMAAVREAGIEDEKG